MHFGTQQMANYFQVLTRENEQDRILDRLWTAGETACVSVHGANRLGANSLVETVVFGKAIADNIDCMMRPGERHGELGPVSIRGLKYLKKLNFPPLISTALFQMS